MWAMTEDLMRYDQLAQNALRGVVREALRHVVRQGLPGEHHFYIAFNTRFPGVDISEKLMQRYPREMTIVLQHQYSDLIVTEEHFEVVLFFDQTPERLYVPFAAVKGFLDPSVQFGLQFEVVVVEPKLAEDSPSVLQMDIKNSPNQSDKENTKETEEAGAAASTEPKVVSLDSFRKK
jgi:uncharacterized protein